MAEKDEKPAVRDAKPDRERVADAIMTVSVVWIALGMYFFELYWILGGTLLFVTEVLTLPDPPKG